MSVSDSWLKRCRDCGQEKPLTEFPPAGRSRDGRGTYCRACYRERSKASYRKRAREDGRDVREAVEVAEGHKLCPECREVKPHGEYPRNARTKSGVCAVCAKSDPDHVDHDHNTGKVRGMLCFNCHQALGNVRDSIEVLGKLQDYLIATAAPDAAIPFFEVRLHQAIVEWTGKCHGGVAS